MHVLNMTPYSDKAKEIARELIPRLRNGLELPTTDAMEGVRFNSDDSVLVRLEVMTKEEEFMNCPIASIESALIEAARSDYWYENEKEYEMDLPTDDMEDGDD